VARLVQRLSGKDFDWLACVGLIAESAADRYGLLFQRAYERFPELCSSRNKRSPEESCNDNIKNITYTVAAAFWAPPGEYERHAFGLLSRLVRQYSPRAFFDPSDLEARRLIRMEREVRSEINRQAAEAEYHSYYAPEISLRFAEVSSDYRVGGVVATRLAGKHKHDIVVTGQIYTGRYVIEARRGPSQSVDVAELLKQASRNLRPFSFGGHPAAAGATLPLESSSHFFVALEDAVRPPDRKDS
jgi:single-stranded DNA-specific DHH superfamily exonuclease